MRGRLARTPRRPDSPVGETAPAPAASAAGSPAGSPVGEGPRGRRLRAHLDHPAPELVVRRGSLLVSGWVFHDTAEVLGVVVSVDGVVRGAAAVDGPRPDVAEHHPEIAAAAHCGWSVTVELPEETGTSRDLAVFAVLRGGGDDASARRLVRVARRTLLAPGSVGAGIHGGCFVDTGPAVAGYSRVLGLADAPGGVAYVEVSCDGRPVGRARTALIGNFERLDQGPESALALFEISIPIPAVEQVTLTAKAHACDGTVFELRPMQVDVDPAPPATWDEDRLAVVRDRTARHLAELTGPRDAGDRSAARTDLPSVLVVTHDLGLGGGQLYLQELIVRLQRRGVHCAVSSPRGGRLVAECEALGMPVLVTGVVDVHDAEAYESQVLQIASWAVRHGCEAVIANTMSAHPGVDAAQRLGLPVVWAIHESFPLAQFWTEALAPPVPAYAAERAEAALLGASRLVFEAAATRDLYAPHTAPGAGVVVPYGVDLDAIEAYRAAHDRAALRAELGFDESTLVLLCMGTIEPRKAQVNLALAFSRSAALRERGAVLVMVGAQEGSAYVQALETALEAMDDPRVVIEPVQPDTYRWYHAADVLVCASDVESLPRSMLEAMAFGRPVASTAVFGIPDLVTPGESGWLCEPRDLLGLRTMLDDVGATSPAAVAELGRTAREVVRTRHDPAVYEQYYLDTLLELTGRVS